MASLARLVPHRTCLHPGRGALHSLASDRHNCHSSRYLRGLHALASAYERLLSPRGFADVRADLEMLESQKESAEKALSDEMQKSAKTISEVNASLVRTFSLHYGMQA